MSIDTAALLAEKYKTDPNPLKAAVLGQGTGDINPYAALRALQMQKDAERFMAMQAAMNGQKYQNQPSMVQQALAPNQQPQMPQQTQPQQPQPQGLEQMQQMQQPQPEQPSPGLEGMPAGDQSFAGGGIIAFAGDDGSLVEDNTDPLQDLMPSPGDPASYSQFSRMLPGAMRNVAQQQYVPMTDEAYDAAIQGRYGMLQALSQPKGTENPYETFRTQLSAQDTARQEALGQNKGLAMMAASGDVLQPGGLMRGIGAAGKTFATQYGQAMTADKAEQRSIQSMQFNIADAERKERMGLGREAIAAADQARKDHDAAQKFKLDKSKALAQLAISGARATRPTGTGGAGKEPKGYDNLTNSIYQDLLTDPANKGVSPTKLKAKAAKDAANLWGKAPGSDTLAEKERATDTTQGTKVNEALAKWDYSRQAVEAKRDGTYAQKKAAKKSELESAYPSRGSGNNNSSGSAGSTVNYSNLWGG